MSVTLHPTLPDDLLDILHLATQGASVADMAAKLYLAEISVKQRIRRLYRILGVRDRAHAVAVAYEIGVLRPSGSAAGFDHLPAGNAPVGRLVEARKRAGILQADAAVRLGMSREGLSRREVGRRRFSVDEARRYGRLVGVDVDGPA